MGESFKLHSQSLIGYEDSLQAGAQIEDNNTNTPQTIPEPHVAEVAAY